MKRTHSLRYFISILLIACFVFMLFSNAFAITYNQQADIINIYNAETMNYYIEKLYLEQFITHIHTVPEPKPLPDDVVFYDLKLSLSELVLHTTVYSNGPFPLTKPINQEPISIYIINEEYGVVFDTVEAIEYDPVTDDKIYIFRNVPEIEYDIYVSVEGYKKEKSKIEFSRLYPGNYVFERDLAPYWRRYVSLIPLTAKEFVPFWVRVLDKNGKPYVNLVYGYSIDGNSIATEGSTDMNGSFLETFSAPLGTKLNVYIVNPFGGKAYKEFKSEVVVTEPGQVFVLIPQKNGKIVVSSPAEVFNH